MKQLALTAALTVVTATAVQTASAQTPATINFAALVARTDSFVVLAQGNTLGFQRTTIERTETGIRVIDDVNINPLMSQHTEVELGVDGSLRSTKQTGKVRGQETKIEISYSDGRAKGLATVPSMAGALTTNIDTTVTSGAIDDNLITALLPAMEWSPSAWFTIPVFLSGKGYVQTQTLTVKGTEMMTVPAGLFEVYRVELSGGQAPVVMYITTATPHRLVKIAPQGAPIEFVLAK